TFHFTVLAEEAPVPERDKPHSRAELLTGRRVLVVDDNATNRKIFRLQCERWGMRVREAAEPETALEWVRQGENFDLAIIDHQMPGMDGAQLTQEIRKVVSAERMPILLASSLGEKPESYGPDFGVSSFLTKPVKQSQLLDALVSTLAPALEEVAAVVAPAAAPVTKTLRILLAEDNPVNQKVATRMMQKLGYTIEVANNGEEALEAAKAAVSSPLLEESVEGATGILLNIARAGVAPARR
ncbi:MAG: response regulator, partial [Thermoplasmatota archaeon]